MAKIMDCFLVTFEAIGTQCSLREYIYLPSMPIYTTLTLYPRYCKASLKRIAVIDVPLIGVKKSKKALDKISNNILI